MTDISDQIASILGNMKVHDRYNLTLAICNAANSGDNDLCWCGSSATFIKCHKGRHSLNQISMGEFAKELNKIFKKNEICCASFDSSNCKLPIKSAHTIQRGRVLSSFAVDGHVGSFYQKQNGLKIKSGISKHASVFYGFCDNHDTELFKDIETKDFDVNKENCRASSYRAVCHEYYQKLAANEAEKWKRNNLDKGRPLYEQIILQNSFCFSERAVKKGLGDIEIAKDKYDSSYKNDSVSGISFKVLKFDCAITVAVCGVITPFYSIDGNKIQDLGLPGVVFEGFAISTVLMDGKAVYVIGYLDSHTVISNYLDEVFLKDAAYIKDWLYQVIYSYTENVYFDLNWWNGLCQDSKNIVFNLHVSRNSDVKFDVDDSISKLINGDIVSIQTL